MSAEHRFELALYFVGVFVAGLLAGFQLGRGRWMEVIGAAAVLALLFVGIQFTKEAS